MEQKRAENPVLIISNLIWPEYFFHNEKSLLLKALFSSAHTIVPFFHFSHYSSVGSQFISLFLTFEISPGFYPLSHHFSLPPFFLPQILIEFLLLSTSQSWGIQTSKTVVMTQSDVCCWILVDTQKKSPNQPWQRERLLIGATLKLSPEDQVELAKQWWLEQSCSYEGLVS